MYEVVSFPWGFLLLYSVLCIRRLCTWLLELVFVRFITLIMFGEARHLRNFQKPSYLQPPPTPIPSTFCFPMPITKFFVYKSVTRLHIGETSLQVGDQVSYRRNCSLQVGEQASYRRNCSLQVGDQASYRRNCSLQVGDQASYMQNCSFQAHRHSICNQETINIVVSVCLPFCPSVRLSTWIIATVIERNLDFGCLLHFLGGDRGGTVVKVLCYKSEVRWFDPSWCQWNFSLT